MEKVLKLGGGRSQSIDITLDYLVSQRWSVDSHKNKYVNGKQSGQIPVGYQIYLDNPTDYLLEEDGNSNIFQITPMNSAGGTSAICSLTQEESGEQIDINITTPSEQIDNDILVTISRGSGDSANIDISSTYKVASDINFSMVIQYGVSPSDIRTVETTLNSGDSFTSINTPIQKEATPLILSGDYWPKEDDKYKYIVSFM